MSTEDPRALCVVGLGMMGSGIAGRLRATGWDVSGRDVDDAAERRATMAGVRIATDDDVRAAGTVITCLPDDHAVLDAVAGDSGLLHNMRRGSRLIETSTILPATIRAVHRQAADASIEVIDCGLSGGPAEAANGTLTLLVGGDGGSIATVSDLLAALGTVIRAGGVGDAKTVKLVNNVMSIGNVVIAAEAFNLGLRAGISGARLMEVLSASGGRSHQFLKRFPKLLESDFTPRFALALGLKDTRLALRLADDLDMPLQATTAIAARLEQAIEAGLGAEDLIAVAKLDRASEGA